MRIGFLAACTVTVLSGAAYAQPKPMSDEDYIKRVINGRAASGCRTGDGCSNERDIDADTQEGNQ
jgi:hypothetical protein